MLCECVSVVTGKNFIQAFSLVYLFVCFSCQCVLNEMLS